MKKRLIISIACFVGSLALFLIMSRVSAASVITIGDQPTLHEIISFKISEKKFLEIQKKDAAELKAFSANPKHYAILSTENPINALGFLQDVQPNEKRLAGSVMVPIDNPKQGDRSFKRIYKVYLILKSF